MKDKLTFLIKIGAIATIAILLLIPLSMIRNLINERSSYREEAMASIAETWAAEQSMTGPILVIPYQQKKQVKEWDVKKKTEKTREVINKHFFYLQPQDLNITSTIQTEERYKGIYTFPAYRSSNHITGTFKIKGLKELLSLEGVSLRATPFLIFGVQDTRGINAAPQILWDQQTAMMQPGCPNNLLSSGMHTELPAITSEEEGRLYAFEFTIQLQGMDSFKVVPVGENVSVDFVSNWQHPGFVGPYPASDTSVAPEGFTASWQISHFATDMSSHFNQRSITNFNTLDSEAVGVRLVDPVDIYQTTDRSMKYGFLFVALTFTSFFLYELMRKLKIHPVQYTLVGVALALFFLLLLSLSEHLSFIKAYLIAATSCVGLISYYVSHVLGSWKRAGGFGALLALIYAALYSLLRMEDYALLTGTLLIFLLLALVMILTRKLNWHDLIQEKDSEDPSTPPSLPIIGKPAL